MDAELRFGALAVLCVGLCSGCASRGPVVPSAPSASPVAPATASGVRQLFEKAGGCATMASGKDAEARRIGAMDAALQLLGSRDLDRECRRLEALPYAGLSDFDQLSLARLIHLLASRNDADPLLSLLAAHAKTEMSYTYGRTEVSLAFSALDNPIRLLARAYRAASGPPREAILEMLWRSFPNLQEGQRKEAAFVDMCDAWFEAHRGQLEPDERWLGSEEVMLGMPLYVPLGTGLSPEIRRLMNELRGAAAAKKR